MIHKVRKSLPRFTRFLVLIRLVFTEIQPIENVKIYEMYGNPDAVRHGVRMPYIVAVSTLLGLFSTV